VTDENRKQREAAALEVEEIIDVEFEHLQARYKRKRADRVISAMYESAERVKAQELETALGKMDDVDDDQRAIVESMADAIVSQLLSAPTKSLRDAAEQDDWSTINTALQLFDPEFGPDEIVPPGAGADTSTGEFDPSDIPETVREQMPAPMLEQIRSDE
jgi:glutamyl-tRNA reductase